MRACGRETRLAADIVVSPAKMCSNVGDHSHDHVRLPDFLIIGGLKCATTSLHAYLGQHPAIYISPIKEPRYFLPGPRPVGGYKLEHYRRGVPSAGKRVSTLEDYHALFDLARPGQILGEASPNYLANPQSPKLIAETIPKVKLIAVLRNPIDRAYSHFLHHLRTGVVRWTSFDEIVQKRNRYVDEGRYRIQIETYLHFFHERQLKLLLFDDVAQDTNASVEQIQRFLNIDAVATLPTEQRLNASGPLPKSRWLYRLSKLPRPRIRQLEARLPLRVQSAAASFRSSVRMFNNSVAVPPMSDFARNHLREIYRDDIEWLERFLDRDLAHWLD